MVPDAFRKLCSYLHQDVGFDGLGPDDWIAIVQKNLSQAEKSVVRRFLSELLNHSATDEDLMEVWRKSDADILFAGKGELRRFLEFMLKTLFENQSAI